MVPRLRESRLLTTSGRRGGDFTQPRAYSLAHPCIEFIYPDADKIELQETRFVFFTSSSKFVFLPDVSDVFSKIPGEGAQASLSLSLSLSQSAGGIIDAISAMPAVPSSLPANNTTTALTLLHVLLSSSCYNFCSPSLSIIATS